jgi:DNA-binding MarR family transcriptional regulator
MSQPLETATTPGDESRAGGVDLGPLPGLLVFALRRAVAAVSHDFQSGFEAAGIRPNQFAVLLVLRHNPGLRQSQVSFALGIKRTNFVPLFDELERRGLAERRKVPGDRRAAALFLTKAGSDLLGKLERLAEEHEARMAARLGPGGKPQLLSLLHQLGDRAFDPDAD